MAQGNGSSMDVHLGRRREKEEHSTNKWDPMKWYTNGEWLIMQWYKISHKVTVLFNEAKQSLIKC